MLSDKVGIEDHLMPTKANIVSDVIISPGRDHL